MATMIGTYDCYLFTKDDAFLSANWAKYRLAMIFITTKTDSTGMLDVTGTNHWGRLTQGGHDSEANMLYKVVTSGSSLATWMNDSSLSNSWLVLAAILEAAVNNASNNWDATAGSVVHDSFRYHSNGD
jgi:hypothetical protein